MLQASSRHPDGPPLSKLRRWIDSLVADDADEEEPFLSSDHGRTTVEGLYACGWLSDETAHQAVVNAGHGARVALSVIRDDLRDRYWDDLADRYGGDGWADHIDEWFDREMVPDDHDLDDDLVAQARADISEEFLGRCIDDDERQRRDRDGQWRQLEQLDDNIVREYATTITDD